MTAQTITAPAQWLAAPARPQLMSRALLLLLIASFGAETGFYLLLSVVPLYATSVGASGVGAGLATGALMFATVAAEMATPRLVGRFGYRLVFAVGLVLLGAPALALVGATGMAVILAVCVVRGLGFAIVVVVGAALVARLVPAERRGEGLGLYGLVVGVPAVVALPLGVWLAGQVGYPLVFVAGTGAVLAGLLLVGGLPGRQAEAEEPVGVLAGLRNAALLRPATVFAATTMACGVVVSFLPVAVTGSTGGSAAALAALALLAQAAAATLTRWWAGRLGDRHGSAGMLVPGLVASAAGILALVLIDSPVAVVGGMVLFGAGFGVTQNATLSLMFDRVPASGYGAASALWNLSYDAGLGIGAAGFGLLAAQTGYPAAFAVTGALMLVALVPAWRDRAASR
jgi:predicted MFS family arabinose efflux permease